MSAIVSGSPMPLFERLVAGEALPARGPLLDADALRASVAQELGRLVGTRSRLDADAFATSEGTVIDYGIPDFSARSAQSGVDREAVAESIRHAIKLFEPRLADPVVRFDAPGTAGAIPVLTIEGKLRTGSALARVAFALAPGGEAAADPRWIDHD